MTTCQSQRLARFLNRLTLLTLVASMTFGLLSPVAATVVQAEAQPTTATSSSATSIEKAPVAPATTAGTLEDSAAAEAKAQAAYQAKVQQVKHYQQGFLAGWKAQGDAEQGASLTDPDEKLGFAQGLAANTARANLMGTDYADATNQAAQAYAAQLGVKAADVDWLPAIFTRAKKWGTEGKATYAIDAAGNLTITGGPKVTGVAGIRKFFTDGDGKAYKDQIKTITIKGSIVLKGGIEYGYQEGIGKEMFANLPHVTSITGLENITFSEGNTAINLVSGLTNLKTISIDYQNAAGTQAVTDYARMFAGDKNLTHITFNVDTSGIANKKADNIKSPTANPFPFNNDGGSTFDLDKREDPNMTIKIGWLVGAEIKLPQPIPAGYRWVDEADKPAVDGNYRGAKVEGLTAGQYKTYHLAPLPEINLNYVNEKQALIQATPVTQPADGKTVQVPLLDMYADDQKTGNFANYVYKDDPYQLKGLTRDISADTNVAMMPVQAKGRLAGSDVNWYVDMAGTLHIGPGKLGAAVEVTLPNTQKVGPFQDLAEMINKVVFDGKVIAGGSVAKMFLGLTKVTAIEGLDKLDISNTVSLEHTFSELRSLSEIDVSSLQTGKVTNFTGTFAASNQITDLDLENWDVGKGKYMSAMFQGMTSLKTLHITGWKTDGIVGITNAFADTTNLEKLDLTGWNLSTAPEVQTLALFGSHPENSANLEEITLGEDVKSNILIRTPAGRQWQGVTNKKTFVKAYDPALYGPDTYRLTAPPVNMKFRLTDAYSGDALKGLAGIDVINAKGEYVTTMNFRSSSEFQRETVVLPEGEYTLRMQAVVVDDYQRPVDFKFTVSNDKADAEGNQVVNIDLIPNDQSIIPNTGSNDQLYFYLAVAALGSTAIAGGVWQLNKRRRELAELLEKLKKMN